MSRYVVLLLLMLSSSLAGAGYARHKPTVSEVRELLPSVCSSGVGTGACTPCPAFTRATAGKSLVLESVVYGQFTHPKQTDALLEFLGCDAPVANYGGSVLLRWQGGGRWTFSRYLMGYRAGDCLNYPARDGRDLLLCKEVVTGSVSLVLNDFSREDRFVQTLFYAEDSRVTCSPFESVQKLLEWKQVAARAGGYPGLRATVASAAYQRLPPRAGSSCTGTLVTSKSRNYTLEYSFDGRRFTPTEATEKLFGPLLKDNPDMFYEGGNG